MTDIDDILKGPESETVYLDNGDGTGWRVDPEGWSHPLVAVSDGWQETGGQPEPPDPSPHVVGIASGTRWNDLCECRHAAVRHAPSKTQNLMGDCHACPCTAFTAAREETP